MPAILMNGCMTLSGMTAALRVLQSFTRWYCGNRSQRYLLMTLVLPWMKMRPEIVGRPSVVPLLASLSWALPFGLPFSDFPDASVIIVRWMNVLNPPSVSAFNEKYSASRFRMKRYHHGAGT